MDTEVSAAEVGMKNGLFITVFVMVAFLLSFQNGHGTQHVISEVLRIDNAAGLSSQKVYSFAEDENGAIWIGTKSGVDRYNGRLLKNYSLAGDSSYGDKAGRIIRLYLDSGDLYAYESTGKVHKYSPVYDAFILTGNLQALGHGDVVLNKMLVNDDGSILYATNDGLFKYVSDEDYRLILPGVAVNDIIAAKEYLFVATSSGLKIMRGDHAVKDVSLLNDADIQSLLEKARAFDPFGHAGLTPLGEIRITLAGEIRMTPVEASAGEFFL